MVWNWGFFFLESKGCLPRIVTSPNPFVSMKNQIVKPDFVIMLIFMSFAMFAEFCRLTIFFVAVRWALCLARTASLLIIWKRSVHLYLKIIIEHLQFKVQKWIFRFEKKLSCSLIFCRSRCCHCVPRFRCFEVFFVKRLMHPHFCMLIVLTTWPGIFFLISFEISIVFRPRPL